MDGWLPDWLTQRARISPDRLALIFDDGDEHWTFAALDEMVTVYAGLLDAFGVNAGQRVAMLMVNCGTFVVLVHALSRLGAVLVPLNTRLAAAEIGWQLRDVRASWLFYDQEHAEAATTAAHDLPELRLASVDEIGGEAIPTTDWRPDTNRFNLNALHSIIYTSGTTGHPKGVLLTYGNHWWSAIGSASTWD